MEIQKKQKVIQSSSYLELNKYILDSRVKNVCIYFLLTNKMIKPK